MRALALLFFLLASASAREVSIPGGGQPLLPEDWQNASKAMGRTEFWKAEKADFGTHGQGWRLEVLDDKAGPYQLQLNCPVQGSAKSGDKLLLTFHARCLPTTSTDGKGRLQAFIEIKEAPNYVKLGQDSLELTSEWQIVTLPFPANADSKPGLTYVAFLPGGKKQTLEISQLRLLNYGADFDLARLPRPYIHYPGREASAPWRKAALERIEKIRTTPIHIQVASPDGSPLPDAPVSLSLLRHAFAFGTAVKAKYFHGDDERSQKYRSLVENHFSAIVLENDLKPFGWSAGKTNSGTEYRQEWTQKALTWAKTRGMKVRGHYLAWGPWEPWSEKLKETPETIREQVFSHSQDLIHGTAGLIDEWDAVNHPVGWENPRRTVDQAISPSFYADVFKLARQHTAQPLIINEDQVFRPGRQQDEFYTCIQDLIQRGAKPDGIGNQAHFHSSFLPGPEEMLRVSDRFAALVPNLVITEFDVVTNGDEELQADWLRDSLIMAYSHPAYSAFMLWVFWEGAGWKPECALWRKDGSEKPNAKAWKDLVCKLWLTKASGNADASGQFQARGHRGLYEVQVTHPKTGQKTKHLFSTESGTSTLRVILP